MEDHAKEPDSIIKPRGTRGGYRPGSGRKPMKVEDDVKSAIRESLAKDPERMTRIWDRVFEKAEKGSKDHITILFNYYYGKPVEHVQVATQKMILKRIIVKE